MLVNQVGPTVMRLAEFGEQPLSGLFIDARTLRATALLDTVTEKPHTDLSSKRLTPGFGLNPCPFRLNQAQ